MQIRAMTKRPANWKALAGVATAGAIGLGGLALADPGRAEIPPSISLVDLETAITSVRANPPNPTTIIPSDIDSPFADVGDTTPEPSLDDPTDSPEASPAANPTGDDSPDVAHDSPDGSGGS